MTSEGILEYRTETKVIVTAKACKYKEDQGNWLLSQWNHTGTRKVYFMAMPPSAKVKNNSLFFAYGNSFLLTRQGVSVRPMVRITGQHLSMKFFIQCPFCNK